MNKMQLFQNVANDLRKLADSIQFAVGAIEQGEQPGAVADPEPSPPKTEPSDVKLEQVRAVLAEKSRAGHTAAIRELLEKYGATRLSEIAPEEYPALLAEAEVLGDG